MTTGSTDTETFAEKRRFNRLDKSFTMHFKVMATESLPVGELDRTGLVCDIGAGGLRFVTTGVIEKNEQLLILLEFSGWQVDGEEWIPTGNPDDRGKLKVLGRVMWVSGEDSVTDEKEVGICFVGRIY